MYRVILLPDAEESFKALDNPVKKRIAEKIDWLANNADKSFKGNARRSKRFM